MWGTDSGSTSSRPQHSLAWLGIPCAGGCSASWPAATAGCASSPSCGQAAEPGLLPPRRAAPGRAGVVAAELRRRAATPTTASTSPAAPSCCPPPAPRCTPGCGWPAAHRPPAAAGAAAGAVPVHRQQRPLADGRGAAQQRSGGAVEARSAGSHPKPLHPDAVRVMAERGIDISRRPTTKHLDGSPAPLRPGHHPLRPGPGDLPRVPGQPSPSTGACPTPPHEHRRRRLPGVRAHRRRAREPHRFLLHIASPTAPTRRSDDHRTRRHRQRPLHGRRRRRPRSTSTRPISASQLHARCRPRSPTSAAATCACC